MSLIDVFVVDADQSDDGELLATMVQLQQQLVSLEHELEQVRDENGHLKLALTNSRQIGAAIGVLMASRKILVDKVSSCSNRHPKISTESFAKWQPTCC
jgi:hypothetical protein